MDKQKFEDDEALEFDYFLQWEWPAHIEETLRQMLWISLVEACEPGNDTHKHTALLRWQIATYPDSPPAVLDLLANLDEPSLVTRVAENPKTWAVTLIRLAQHKHSQVRIAVAENANMPFAVMKILAADECPDVCYSMAENPTLPSKLLRQLSENDNPYVAVRAARTMARRSPKVPDILPLLKEQMRKAEGQS